MADHLLAALYGHDTAADLARADAARATADAALDELRVLLADAAAAVGAARDHARDAHSRARHAARPRAFLELPVERSLVEMDEALRAVGAGLALLDDARITITDRAARRRKRSAA